MSSKLIKIKEENPKCPTCGHYLKSNHVIGWNVVEGMIESGVDEWRCLNCGSVYKMENEE